VIGEPTGNLIRILQQARTREPRRWPTRPIPTACDCCRAATRRSPKAMATNRSGPICQRCRSGRVPSEVNDVRPEPSVRRPPTQDPGASTPETSRVRRTASTGLTSPVATRRRSRRTRDGDAPRRVTWAPPSRLGTTPLLRSPPTPAGDVRPEPSVRRPPTQDPGASTPETSRVKNNRTDLRRTLPRHAVWWGRRTIRCRRRRRRHRRAWPGRRRRERSGWRGRPWRPAWWPRGR
jgi:hypothetical protein